MSATLAHCWRDRARRQPDAVAVDDGRWALTWSDILRRARGAAHVLGEAGVGAEDVVVLRAPNTTGWVVAACAVHLLGATLAPLGHERPYDARLLERLGARVAVVDRRSAPQPGAPTELLLGDLLAVEDGPEPAERPEPPATGSGPAPAVILASSGTAGAQRLVPMRHDTLIRLYADVATALDIDSRDRLLGLVPLAHSFGFNGVLMVALLSGASVRLVPERDPAGLPGLVRDAGVTVLPGPPTLLHDLHSNLPAGADLGPQVRLFMSGASEIRPSVMLPRAAALGIPRTSGGYGMTETSGTIALCADISSHDGDHVPMTALPGIEVRVLDAHGAPAGPGVRGRVVTRGYQVAVPTRDGWLDTGDEGHLHEDGRLCVTGRLDDQLVVSGFNVDPARVESLLEATPQVTRAAVIGLPDPRRGHRLVALAVPAHDDTEHATAQALGELRGRAAGYEVPDQLLWVDELPVSSTGKLSRATVRRLVEERLTSADRSAVAPGTEERP